MLPDLTKPLLYLNLLKFKKKSDKIIFMNDKLYYKPSEVCKIADIKPYVLSYWETEFSQLGHIVKGQKLYTQEDLDLVLKIKKLLYEDGFTISGAKKQLEKEEIGVAQKEIPLEKIEKSDNIDKKKLREVIEELQDIIQWLKK